MDQCRLRMSAVAAGKQAAERSAGGPWLRQRVQCCKADAILLPGMPYDQLGLTGERIDCGRKGAVRRSGWKWMGIRLLK